MFPGAEQASRTFTKNEIKVEKIYAKKELKNYMPLGVKFENK